jgi:peptidoglycan/LPS O-acetylase OafA/YrhL
MPVYPVLPEPEYYRYTLGTLAAAVIVACIAGGKKPSLPILCSWPLTYVGKISYGTYVLHPIVLGCVSALAVRLGLLQSASYFVAIAVYLAALIVVAGLSFRFFESPILRFKERFAR